MYVTILESLEWMELNYSYFNHLVPNKDCQEYSLCIFIKKAGVLNNVFHMKPQERFLESLG